MSLEHNGKLKETEKPVDLLAEADLSRFDKTRNKRKNGNRNRNNRHPNPNQQGNQNQKRNNTNRKPRNDSKE